MLFPRYDYHPFQVISVAFSQFFCSNFSTRLQTNMSLQSSLRWFGWRNPLPICWALKNALQAKRAFIKQAPQSTCFNSTPPNPGVYQRRMRIVRPPTSLRPNDRRNHQEKKRKPKSLGNFTSFCWGGWMNLNSWNFSLAVDSFEDTVIDTPLFPSQRSPWAPGLPLRKSSRRSRRFRFEEQADLRRRDRSMFQKFLRRDRSMFQKFLRRDRSMFQKFQSLKKNGTFKLMIPGRMWTKARRDTMTRLHCHHAALIMTRRRNYCATSAVECNKIPRSSSRTLMRIASGKESTMTLRVQISRQTSQWSQCERGWLSTVSVCFPTCDLSKGLNSLYQFPEALDQFPETLDQFWEALDQFPEALHQFPEALDQFPETLDQFWEALDQFPEALHQFPEALDQFPETLDQFWEALDQFPEALHQFPEALDQFPEALDQFSEALDQFREALDQFSEALGQFPEALKFAATMVALGWMPRPHGCVALFLKLWPVGCFSAHGALCTLQVPLHRDRISKGEADKLYRFADPDSGSAAKRTHLHMYLIRLSLHIKLLHVLAGRSLKGEKSSQWEVALLHFTQRCFEEVQPTRAHSVDGQPLNTNFGDYIFPLKVTSHLKINGWNWKMYFLFR